MKKEVLAKRCRALHDPGIGLLKKLSRLLVNRNTWLLLTSVLRFFVWVARLIQQFM